MHWKKLNVYGRIPMKKEITTQKMLFECPNCGAPRGANEKICRFCGSALVSKTVVTVEMSEESAKRQFVADNSYPTIVSKLRPAWLTEPKRLLSVIIAGSSIALGLLLYIVFPEARPTAWIFFACALFYLAYELPAVVKYKYFLRTAPEYEAAVVSVDKHKELNRSGTPWSEPEYTEYTTMTVLFRYDGEKTFGLFRVSDNITRGMFGKGEKILIKVKDGNIAPWRRIS